MKTIHKETRTERLLKFFGLEWNPKPLLSVRKIEILVALSFLAGLGILAAISSFWPGILLVIGCSMVLRKLLYSRNYAAMISAVVFGGLFYTLWSQSTWRVEVPVILTVAAVTLVFREIAHLRRPLPQEKLEEINLELKDEHWE